MCCLSFFFFQAEDGIRDIGVTGVQTCALPISEGVTRIIAGTAGGRRLRVPPSGVRPTGDRAREGLFNSLSTLTDLEGAAVLDLYAGSGALGLEALSRGAAQVVFVENGPRVLPVLRANIDAVGLPGARVVSGSVPTVVAGDRKSTRLN